MSKANKAAPNGDSRILIVLYSHSGNTRTLAELIRQQSGGDLVEIQSVAPYPSAYDAVVKQANSRPRTSAPPSRRAACNRREHPFSLGSRFRAMASMASDISTPRTWRPCDTMYSAIGQPVPHPKSKIVASIGTAERTASRYSRSRPKKALRAVHHCWAILL